MVQGPRSNYPEGFTHALPLLMALLPGIDPNDIRKCMVTFNFMVHFINMIPLVNCSEASKYYEDLTEEEHIVCEATDGFEDFILQFFDRLCLWVDSNSLDFVRLEQVASSQNNKNRTEVIAESALFSIVSAILHQCSPQIFAVSSRSSYNLFCYCAIFRQTALKKVFNFVCDKVLEIQIAGRMAAIICQGFAKVNPKETLKLFIPHLCDIIERLLNENPNIEQEEHLDAELLYNFQILSEVVDAKSELLHYSDRLTKILDRTLHMNSLTGSQMAARMLENMVTSLTYILPTEFRSSSTPFDTHVKDFLAIRFDLSTARWRYCRVLLQRVGQAAEHQRLENLVVRPWGQRNRPGPVFGGQISSTGGGKTQQVRCKRHDLDQRGATQVAQNHHFDAVVASSLANMGRTRHTTVQ